MMRWWTLATTVVLLSVGCGDDRSTAEDIRCVGLVETTRFGDEGVVAGGLDQSTVDAGAGVLGDVRGLTTGPDGSLWVLDRSWQKIAVFRPDGTFDRVILGGFGEGPGEFEIPQDLASAGTGVSVLDYELRRFTHFDWSGELVSVVSTPESAPYRHLIQGDTLWVVPFSGASRTGSFVYQRRLDGSLIADGPSLLPADQPYGWSSGITEVGDGRILVTTARPGVWMEYSNGSWTRVGAPLFPEDPPPSEELVSEQVIQVTPSQYQATSIAVVGDSLVFQAFTAFPEPFDWDDPPERDAVIRSLAVFDLAGEYIDTLDLPDGVEPFRIHSAGEPNRIFLVASDPFPQVVEFQLATCRDVE